MAYQKLDDYRGAPKKIDQLLLECDDEYGVRHTEGSAERRIQLQEIKTRRSTNLLNNSVLSIR